MKKFVLTEETKTNFDGKTLFRIKACADFVTVHGEEVHTGDLGGFIENESNLSQDGKAWVCGNAEVSGNASVSVNAYVSDYAKVFDNAEVYGNAKVFENAAVFGDAKVRGNDAVFGNQERKE